jgi:cytoskeletal protein RodZ
MAWFSRNKTNQDVLPEIERYYDAEKRERAGLAWLLALVSIACVALFVIGVFFGGRWVYRKATSTRKSQGISVTNEVNDNTVISKNPDIASGDSKGTSPTSTPAPTAPTAPTPPAVTPPSPKPVATTPSPTVLVNTGPANIVVIYMITVVGFTALHQILSRSRRNLR